MLLPLLGSALVGGLIGYGTNWLAIKMLFWPLSEKRLGGWRIPFTPGLIPKKRAMLAVSLGDTVGNYLVTTATLDAAVAAPEFVLRLEKLVTDSLTGLEQSDRNVEWLLTRVGVLPQVRRLVDQSGGLILNWLQSPRALEQLQPIAQRLLSTAGRATVDRIGGLVMEMDAATWKELLDSADCLPALRQAVTARLTELLVGAKEQPLSLSQLFSPESQALARQYLLRSSPDWFDGLQTILAAESSRQMVKRLAKEFLLNNPMLRVIGAFVNLDRFTESLPNLLAKEEVRAELTLMLLGANDRLWQTPLAQLLDVVLPAEGLSPERIQPWVDQVLTTDRIRQWLQETDWTDLAARLQSLLAPFATSLGAGMRQLWQQVLADEQTHALVSGLTGHWFDQLLALPLRQLLPRSLVGDPAFVGKELQRLLSQVVSRHGQTLLAALQLPQVVEAQVNALNIVEVEEILLRVMREQLTTITNLGFLLGAVVGLALPSLNAWLAGLGL